MIVGLSPSTSYTIRIFSGSVFGDFERVGSAINASTQGLEISNEVSNK